MRQTNTHIFFWGSCFSNWFLTSFEYKNELFANSEQALMFEKARLMNDHVSKEKILKENDPKKVKILGRKVAPWDQELWDQKCLELMTDILIAKFGSNENLRSKLLATGEKVLVEASPHDKIWGIGLHYSDDKVLDEKNWKGSNLLGKSLMAARQKLKSES